MTNLENTLRTLERRGLVSSFIVTRVPSGFLETGWLEENILLSSNAAVLNESDVRLNLSIPTDRLVRLLSDKKVGSQFSRGVFMIGGAPPANSRIAAIVGTETWKGQDTPVAIGVSTTKRDIVAPAAILLGKGAFTSSTEIQLDYLEQMRKDRIEGKLEGFLSLAIPDKKTKFTKWIQSLGDGRIEKDGQVIVLEDLAPLLARWLTALRVFKDMRTPVASLLLSSAETAVLCLWDGPAETVTFAYTSNVEFDRLIAHYLAPLWASFDKETKMDEATPEVTIERANKPLKPRVEEGGKARTKLEDDVASLASRLRAIPVDDIQRRLAALENRQKSSGSVGQPNDQAAAQIVHRFNETQERLEDLTSRLKMLEERLSRLTKNMG